MGAHVGARVVARGSPVRAQERRGGTADVWVPAKIFQV